MYSYRLWIELMEFLTLYFSLWHMSVSKTCTVSWFPTEIISTGLSNKARSKPVHPKEGLTLSTFKITLSTVFVPLCASPSEWLAQGYIFNYQRPMKFKLLCESPLKMDLGWCMQPNIQTQSGKQILIDDIIIVSSLLEHQPGIRCWFEPVLLVFSFDSWAIKWL